MKGIKIFHFPTVGTIPTLFKNKKGESNELSEWEYKQTFLCKILKIRNGWRDVEKLIPKTNTVDSL